MTARSGEIWRHRHVPAGLSALRDRDERLEGLKLIVGKLSHGFNNFLAPILGYVSLIQEEVGEASPAFKYAQTMGQSARIAEADVSFAVMAAQPHRKFQPKSVDFTALLDHEIEEWKTALDAGSGIEIRQDLVPCRTEMDEEQWRGVVRHLLRNARFALAMGGRVELRLKEFSMSAEQAAGLGLADKNGWLFEVQDNGLGMPPETLRRAFDPFFTTRPKGQSSGLGLTLVHGVVRLYGGQVVIESAEDQGTCVRIWIPAVDPALAQAANAGPFAHARSPLPPAEGKKVLVVDDEPLVLEVLSSFLKKCRYDVQTALDGAQALKMFQRKPQDWLLVVSDLTMPNMNGVELITQIRSIRPETRVLFVSGDSAASQSSALNVLQPNVPLLLKKPFTLKGLAASVEQAIAGH